MSLQTLEPSTCSNMVRVGRLRSSLIMMRSSKLMTCRERWGPMTTCAWAHEAKCGAWDTWGCMGAWDKREGMWRMGLHGYIGTKMHGSHARMDVWIADGWTECTRHISACMTLVDDISTSHVTPNQASPPQELSRTFNGTVLLGC